MVEYYQTKKELFRRQRPAQLRHNVPDIFGHKTVLYIGAQTARMDFGDDFRDAGYQIDVLEIYPPNVQYLQKLGWINTVIEGDVRQASELLTKTYDVVFWWHGPEHIEKESLEATIAGLKGIATKLVVLGCPWGRHVKKHANENPHEAHISALYPEDFRKMEFEVSTLGEQDFPGSNVLAWLRKC